jgi:hypothetical protein
MTVETEVAALTSAVNLLTSTVNVSKATLDASVAAAEAAYDSFDDRYLGAKVSAPSLDNDGGSLLTGALYFNSTENAMYVYTGASWVITTNYNNVTAPYTLAQTLNTNGNNVTFGDNGKAIFGAGSDLQIYHDGGHSYIDDSGTGLLRLRSSTIYLEKYTGELMADFNADGHVSLLHDNFEKFRTTATGIDVTGTATMDGLTVVGITTSSNGTYGTKLTYSNGNQSGIIDTFGNHNLEFRTNDDRAMNIAANGDISFYEDTGTTPKFVWSSSAEKLTLSGTGGLDVNTATGSVNIQAGSASADIALGVGSPSTANKVVVTAGGNVGIGTSSPSTLMEIASTSPVLRITNTTDAAWSAGQDIGRLSFYSTDASAVGPHETAFILNESDFGGSQLSGALSFGTAAYNAAATERMRIDSSGNLLVGKAGTSISSTGIEAKADGQLWATRDGNPVLSLNRKTSDGSMAVFYKDGTTVGSIGTEGGRLYIGSDDTSIFFDSGATPSIRPHGPAAPDGVIDIGESGYRFKDLYLSGGVVFGTTGGSVTSKTLDDYETGTWTPVVSGSTTAGSATYTIQQGVYTKIGNVVRWNARVGYTGHTGTGNMLIWGLPFTNANKYAAGSYSFRDGLTLTAGDQLIVSIPPNNTYIGLYGVASGTDTTAALALDTAVSDISINGVYTV